MQAIKCELCGSNQLIKKDGMFQCENCGTKYTLEEARKLIQVQGTITINIEQPDINEILLKAYEAGKNKLWDARRKYMEQAYEIDPTNWEVLHFFAGGRDEYEARAFEQMKKQIPPERIPEELELLWNRYGDYHPYQNDAVKAEMCERFFPNEKDILIKYVIPTYECQFYCDLNECDYDLKRLQKQFRNQEWLKKIKMHQPDYEPSYERYLVLFPEKPIPEYAMKKYHIDKYSNKKGLWGLF